MGSTRTSGRSRGRLESKLDASLAQRLGERREQALHQPVHLLGQRVEGGRAAEAQQVADPAIEPIHFLDDRFERLAGGRRVGVTPYQLGRGPQARQRIPESVGHRGGHLADGRELLRLHQLRLGTLQLGHVSAQALGHPPERARQLADLVPRGRCDRMIELARANHRHRGGEVADGPGEAAGDRPGDDKSHGQRERDDDQQRAAFDGEDLLQPCVGAAHARLPRPPVHLAVHLRERRLQPASQLLLREGERLLAAPRIGQAEDALGHLPDLGLDTSDPISEVGLARAELPAPASLPVGHHLAGQLELAPGTGIQAAEIAPDDLALIEHRGLQLRVGASPRHALAQGIERPPLEPIAPNGFDAHQQSGKHHEREAKQEFALEGHRSNISSVGVA